MKSKTKPAIKINLYMLIFKNFHFQKHSRQILKHFLLLLSFLIAYLEHKNSPTSFYLFIYLFGANQKEHLSVRWYERNARSVQMWKDIILHAAATCRTWQKIAEQSPPHQSLNSILTYM